MIRIALGQVNTTVGDLDGNVSKMAEWTGRAAEAGADLIAFPELAVPGYPPEDLVLRPAFVEDNLGALEDLARETAAACSVLVGFVDRTERGIHNAAGLLAGGRVVARYHKIKLPNYGVFDEQRTFVPGEAACPVRVASADLGISICEDAWSPGAPWDQYAAARVRVIPNINGSPYHRDKAHERLEICRARAAETGAWIVYVNMVGGQDELVFDGGSMVVSPAGDLVWRAKMFEEDLLVIDIDEGADELEDGEGGRAGVVEAARRAVRAARAAPLPDPTRPPWPTGNEEVYRAIVLGLRDYVRKNGFDEVAIGLSGGIDSALVATLATDALGSEGVRCLAMPSAYSSPESERDAREISRRLGVRLDVVPIEEVFAAYRRALTGIFAGAEENVAEENLQARIRGNYVMALANKFGLLALAAGNKSEYAVGYATLYGDMAGGLAPIKDVPKTLVYALARWRNADAEARGVEPPIPERVLAKAPSAELRPNQLDTDSLPPYDVLDPVIEGYVEDDRSPEELIAAGMDPEVVRRVAAMIDHAEYKRRQAPPGVKITPKAFGRDRRLPITNAYRRGPAPNK